MGISGGQTASRGRRSGRGIASFDKLSFKPLDLLLNVRNIRMRRILGLEPVEMRALGGKLAFDQSDIRHAEKWDFLLKR